MLLLSVTVKAQVQYSYTNLNLPGPAFGISGNNIVGVIESAPSAGYLYNSNGITVLSALPGDTTVAYGISGNNIVGTYVTTNGAYGFLYNGGNYTTLAAPDATGTAAVGIDGNNIVGNCGLNDGTTVGFLYNSGNYNTFSVPGAYHTKPTGISGNNIVGFYDNGDGTGSQGFLYNGSSFTTISVPGAVDTYVEGIDGTNIVGFYDNGNFGMSQGFLFNGISYTTLSVPGGTATEARGISGNNIVGEYVGGNGGTYGFLASPGYPPLQTSLLLTSESNPSTYGDEVEFVATVETNGVPVGNIVGETINFFNGPSLIGSGVLDGNGQAFYITAPPQLPAGSNNITAVYPSDSIYLASTNSPPLVQTVNQANLGAGLVGPVIKTYDGTVTATLNASNYMLYTVLDGDTVLLNNPTSGTYDNRNAGVAKNVTVTGLAISGQSAANYVLTNTSVSAIVEIGRAHV